MDDHSISSVWESVQASLQVMEYGSLGPYKSRFKWAGVISNSYIGWENLNTSLPSEEEMSSIIGMSATSLVQVYPSLHVHPASITQSKLHPSKLKVLESSQFSPMAG